MIKDITIGQYLPGSTIVHKLDPRVKILAVTLFIITIFFINSFWFYIPMIIYISGVTSVSKTPFKYLFKGLKSLIIIILVTAFLNMFLTPGEIICSYGYISITKEGLILAVFMSIRLILLVMGTSLLTLTTSPISLTDALESIFSPLKVIKFPAHELAMMMTITLRFIPTLMEETDKIMKAQMARGADFESGNMIKRAKNLVPLIIPLFLNSFRRADELALAMESRCYHGGEGRTRLNPLKMKSKDYAIMFLLIVYFLGIIIGSKLL